MLASFSFSICTNDVFCYICPFDTYDVNYETNLRLSYGQNQALEFGSCLPKNISILKQRNVLVMNSPICVECQKITFDANYNSLGQALENESRFCLTYLYSQINFYLQGGDHYLVKNDFSTINPHFFRRILSDIKIQNFPGEIVNIYLKTNNFFIFVSKTFIVENITFFGYDLVLNEDNPCRNIKNQHVVLESKLNQTYDENINCSIKGAKAITNGIETDYGFFNIEYIFDNPDIEVHPNFILKIVFLIICFY